MSGKVRLCGQGCEEVMSEVGIFGRGEGWGTKVVVGMLDGKRKRTDVDVYYSYSVHCIVIVDN